MWRPRAPCCPPQRCSRCPPPSPVGTPRIRLTPVRIKRRIRWKCARCARDKSPMKRSCYARAWTRPARARAGRGGAWAGGRARVASSTLHGPVAVRQPRGLVSPDRPYLPTYPIGAPRAPLAEIGPPIHLPCTLTSLKSTPLPPRTPLVRDRAQGQLRIVSPWSTCMVDACSLSRPRLWEARAARKYRSKSSS